MKFLVAFAVFAVAFAEDGKVKSDNLPEPAVPFVRDGILRSLVPPVKVAESGRLDISRDSIVQFANEARETRPKTPEVQDVPVEDIVQCTEELSPQDEYVKIAVPGGLVKQSEPIRKDLRFNLLNDQLDVEPIAANVIPAEYDAPISEDLKAQFVDVLTTQIESINDNVLQPSEIQDSPISDDLRLKLVDGQEWPVPEDMAFPFALWPKVNDIVIGIPQVQENEDDSIPEDLKVKFFEVNSANSANTGEQVSENRNVQFPEDLEIRFADDLLPNAEHVRDANLQISKNPKTSLSENRVQVLDELMPHGISVKNADLSKPGKVFPNPIWR